MEKYSRIKALISLDAIRYNFEQMKKNIKEGTKIIAVIKALIPMSGGIRQELVVIL